MSDALWLAVFGGILIVGWYGPTVVVTALGIAVGRTIMNSKPFRFAVIGAFLMVVGLVGQSLGGDTSVNGEIVTRGGVIRLGTGMFLHDDFGHEPVGIKRWSLDNGCDLRIVFITNPDAQIVTAIADEDASMSRLGIMAGIHGGAQSLTVELWKDGDKVCADSPVFDGENADVWVQAVARNP